ncbi:hypothetical protein AYI68_g3951 [Smittium mucronatum]|uniref:Replication-associated protein n=1 Tax=Smittium mucronatum TaxID=133383 RepID=A0A1R0GYH8_9FUNG|nr:hypothetical protein AYI68_g3951 [Smittium mucronatum]
MNTFNSEDYESLESVSRILEKISQSAPDTLPENFFEDLNPLNNFTANEIDDSFDLDEFISNFELPVDQSHLMDPSLNNHLQQTSQVQGTSIRPKKINGKQLLLTYEGLDMPPKEAIKLLKTKVDVEKYAAVLNEIRPGDFSLVVYVNLKKTINTTNFTRFILRNTEPIISTVKSKVGIYKEYFSSESVYTDIVHAKIQTELGPNVRLLKAQSVDEAVDFAKSVDSLAGKFFNDPQGFKRKFKEATSDQIAKKDPNMRFVKIPNIDIWRGQKKSLWLYGKSHLGKTNFAKSLFERPLLVSEMEDLRKFHNHDGIIFDDMNFKDLPEGKTTHILDLEHERSFKGRYKNVTTPADIKKVFTSNTPIFKDEEGARNRIHLLRINFDLRILNDNDPTEIEMLDTTLRDSDFL